MYQNYPSYQNYPNYVGNQNYTNYQSQPNYIGNQGYYIPNTKGNDDRFFPLLAPFLLGGLAGAAIARPYGAFGAPCCPPYYPPYYPYRPYW